MSKGMPDKYDEDGRQWAKELLETLSDELAWSGGIPDSRWLEVVGTGITMRLRSAFPPPAEDARKCTWNITRIVHREDGPDSVDIDKAAAEIESFAESRVEPWRDALRVSTEQLEAMNCSASHAASWVEPRSDATTKQIAKNRALLSDSPAKEGTK
jgi:hypothetical protein